MATIRRSRTFRLGKKRANSSERFIGCQLRAGFSEIMGLRDQMCRAAVSSMSNIAEGFARKTSRDFAHFLDVAKGSAIEVQSLLYVSLDVGYINAAEFKALRELAGEVISLIAGFAIYLRCLQADRQ